MPFQWRSTKEPNGDIIQWRRHTDAKIRLDVFIECAGKGTMRMMDGKIWVKDSVAKKGLMLESFGDTDVAYISKTTRA